MKPIAYYQNETFCVYIIDIIEHIENTVFYCFSDEKEKVRRTRMKNGAFIVRDHEASKRIRLDDCIIFNGTCVI